MPHPEADKAETEAIWRAAKEASSGGFLHQVTVLLQESRPLQTNQCPNPNKASLLCSRKGSPKEAVQRPLQHDQWVGREVSFTYIVMLSNMTSE